MAFRILKGIVLFYLINLGNDIYNIMCKILHLLSLLLFLLFLLILIYAKVLALHKEKAI